MNELIALKKILIVEDLEAIATGMDKVLNELQAEIVYTRYCDDAWLKLKKAQLDEEPFDLVITDLSFKPDHRKVVISDGEELIKTIRQDNIPCKIMVFSIFDRPARIQKLFELYEIDASVLKGRNDSKELLKAIENIRLGGTCISEELLEILHLQKNLTQG